jgi:CrcB protein
LQFDPEQIGPEQIRGIMRSEMLNLVYVGMGGLLGSIGRYVVAGAVYQVFPNSYFPIGTAVVNILGCFVIGFLNGLTELHQLLSPEMRTFLLIGLLGGFTTFSTFGYETIAAMRAGDFVPALANVFIQVIVGLSAVWLGYNVTRYF